LAQPAPWAAWGCGSAPEDVRPSWTWRQARTVRCLEDDGMPSWTDERGGVGFDGGAEHGLGGRHLTARCCVVSFVYYTLYALFLLSFVLFAHMFGFPLLPLTLFPACAMTTEHGYQNRRGVYGLQLLFPVASRWLLSLRVVPCFAFGFTIWSCMLLPAVVPLLSFRNWGIAKRECTRLHAEGRGRLPLVS